MKKYAILIICTLLISGSGMTRGSVSNPDINTAADDKIELDTLDETGLKELVSNQSDNLLMLNIWATYCGPCVKEFPELLKINEMFCKRNYELVTLSMDRLRDRDKAMHFLENQKASSRNYIWGGKNSYDMIDMVDAEWQGSLPYTVLIRPGGEIVYRHAGEIDPKLVKHEISRLLGNDSN